MEQEKKERKKQIRNYFVNAESDRYVFENKEQCYDWILENGQTGIKYEIGYFIILDTKELKTFTKLA